MRKLALISLLALTTPAFAEDLTMDTVLGTTLQEVQAKLTEMGYEVRKGEAEDGKIEVYFVRGNEKGEVYVSPETGKITKLDVES